MKYTKLLSLAAFASFGLAAGSVQGAITVSSTDFAKTNASNDGDFSESGGDYTYSGFSAGASSDMLVVAVSYEGTGFSLSYGGDAMTKAVETATASGVNIWYLANPKATGDLVLDFSGNWNGMGIGIASLGASEGMAIALDTTATHTSRALTISPTFNDSFVMFGGNANSTGGTVALNSPLTSIGAHNNFGSNRGAIGYDNGVSAGDKNYSWTSGNPARGVAAASFYAYAIPEPSSYALLAGCLALSSVMIRRRRS